MRCLHALALLAVIPVTVRAADAPAAAGGDLYVLGVALDQEPNKAAGETIDAYNWCPEEIEKVFREQAGPLHRRVESRLVLGDKATHRGVLEGLAWLRETATKDDLVVMYVGCHGFTDPREGWGVKAADGQNLWGHEIKAGLGKLPCPVLIFIETCTSGGFARAHKDDPPVPANVTAVCACSGKQTTDNHLDVAVAEALYGRADFNHDGVVDLDELTRYVALRYREWNPSPTTAEGGETPVMVMAKSMPGSLPLTKDSPHLVAFARDGALYSALEEKHDGDEYRVHVLGWANRPGPYYVTDEAARDALWLPSDGRPMLVEQNGVWYPARMLGKDGDKFKVRYVGYKEEEVVAVERVRYPFVGDPDAPLCTAAASARNAGAWERVGPAGGWKDIVAGAVLGGRLYTVETTGILWETDLKSGEWKQVGKPEFDETKLMVAAGDRLYAVGRGGLRRIDPKSGESSAVGEAGAWKGTLAAAVLKGRLYSVGKDGGLYETGLEAGSRKQIGKAEFGDTRFLFAVGDRLYAIEGGGNLCRVDPGDGGREQVGAAGAWRATRAGAALAGRLYTTEDNGGLYLTDVSRGGWVQLCKPEFGETRFMFPAGDDVYTIETDGSLYRVHVK